MCLSDPSGDPRPKRNIDLCNSQHCEVDLVSYYPKGKSINYNNIYVIHTKSNKFFNKHFRYFELLFIFLLQKITSNDKFLNFLNDKRFLLRNVSKQIKSSYDIIIVEDLFLLPLAFKIKGNAKIIFDVREYYPKQLELSLFFKIFEQKERYRLCNYFLKSCDYLFTVSEGLAREYKREFDVNMQIFLSVPYRIQNTISQNDKIKIVHHGVANWNRKLENMIEIFNMLDDRFTFDFYLTGDKKYIEKLKLIASSNKRIFFNEPIELNKITSTINKFDIGFFYVEPTTFNLLHCLPNKFFEFIQANLMIAIGPSPDMMGLVQKYNCGVVASNFSIKDMANELNKLTPELIQQYKSNSSLAAKDLCFEVESNKLSEIIKLNK